jgi:3-oxoadipate enol-lactonase
LTAVVNLAHRTEGSEDAPWLLLGGSLGTTLEMWDPQVEGLGDSLRILRFDHRGHGRSAVPDGPYEIADLGRDVVALMDRMGIERASYCGVSIGGMVGEWLAINAPERIERLVLISTAAYLPDAASAYGERAAAVRAAGTPDVVADAVIARWFTTSWAAANPDTVARHRAMIAATPAEGYAGCCEAVATLDEREGLASIAAPTLVISGAQDPATPAELGRAIAEAVPRARFELLDPGAHLASVERAAAVNALIAGHLSDGAQ